MSDAPAKSDSPLLTPVQFLKGVGPDRAELLLRLGLQAAKDVLFFFPREYEDLSQLCSIDELQADQPCSVCGVIDEIDLRNTGAGKSVLGVLLKQGPLFLRALWFNQPYLREKLAVGRRVIFSGTPKLSGFRWELHHPKVDFLAEGQEPQRGQVLPIYSLTEGLKQSQMRRIVKAAVEKFKPFVTETFPDAFLDTHQLWPIQAALGQIHEPNDPESLAQARRRFIYQELLVQQLALGLRRHALVGQSRAPALPATAKIHARIVRLFPYELTADQQQAIAEIGADMGRELPMNRLLQGDVGSGKTVVALYAILLTVAQGHQAVLLAPTEVLAQQHVRTLEERLRESRVRIALLTGSLTAAERRRTLESLAAGTLDVIVATHAVLAADVQFAKLGLVVIDEQHRFGVRQRARLRQAGFDPHYLVMTATPIPRTLAMTQYGDLDVSTLRSPPPGRQSVHTYCAEPTQREKWWEFFRKKLGEGRQGYVVAPLVEESEHVDTANVQRLFETLSAHELAGVSLGLVHGRMSAAEKETAMAAFRKGDTRVLVATSVVEVGVDVANATLMTIEGGERFGLAQLHQLRGRISRGTFPGYLCVFATPQTDDSRERLDAFTRTTDGFELAEVDFRLRGPGDLLSTKQHGLPPLRIADPIRDAETLAEARRDAQALLTSDPQLADPAFARLRQMVLKRYGTALELGDVG